MHEQYWVLVFVVFDVGCERVYCLDFYHCVFVVVFGERVRVVCVVGEDVLESWFVVLVGVL